MHPIVPLLQLINTLGIIEGRKRLQKMVHILQELGAEFHERFQYSFYGMYSLQLKSEIDILRGEELIEEYRVTNSVGIRGTSNLSELLKEFDLSDPPVWADRARHLNQLSPSVLEGASTILYLWHTEADEGIVRNRLLALKPHLESTVDECFSEAHALVGR
jgi:uncharacterized protein YwgA